jgi:hypothetical protein
MLKLFTLFCLVNYVYSSSDEYIKTNLSDVKVLVLQEDTVNIYLNGLLFDNIDTCQVNNLHYNNYFVSNRSNLKIVCKKHYYDYMLCERDLILLSLKINNYQECNLVFSTFDNILEIFVKETINIFKKYIYQQTLYNCLRFFGLFLAVKLVIYIISHDNFDFTNNIYTR